MYVFQAGDAIGETRPSKRRKIQKKSFVDSGTQLFPALFDEKEPSDMIKLRQNLFTDMWAAQESHIEVC